MMWAMEPAIGAELGLLELRGDPMDKARLAKHAKTEHTDV